MLDDWTDFRQTVIRIAIRWTVGLGLVFLIFGLRDFDPARLGVRVFGGFVVGLVMGVVTWARRQATAPLTGDPEKRQR